MFTPRKIKHSKNRQNTHNSNNIEQHKNQSSGSTLQPTLETSISQADKVKTKEANKSRAKAAGKPKAKVAGKSQAKAAGKPHAKAAGKSQAKAAGKSQAKAAGKSQAKAAGKPKAKVAGKSQAKAAGKPHAKAAGKSQAKAAGKSQAKAAGKSQAKAAGKSQAKAAGKPHAKAAGKPKAKAAGKSQAKAAGKSQAKAAGKPQAKAAGKPQAKAAGKPHVKAAGKPQAKAAGKPKAKAASKPKAKVAGKSQAKAAGKSQAKAAGKSQAKAAGKSQAKAAGKPQAKAAGKPQAKAAGKSQAKAIKRTHANLMKKAVLLSDNYLTILPGNIKQDSIILNGEIENQPISKQTSGLHMSSEPSRLILSKEDVISFVSQAIKISPMSAKVSEAIENIAFSSEKIMIHFSKNDQLMLLKAFSMVELKSISLLIGFEKALFELTFRNKLTEFSDHEIINMAYQAINVARPLTGNIRVALEKLVKWIMTEIRISSIEGLQLLPRVKKILEFSELCLGNIVIDKSYKNEINKKIVLLLKDEQPSSSETHQAFSKRLKELFSDENSMFVQDEYFCELLGTHLDIVIPSYKIVVEINGPSHYLEDRVTENPQTKLKRQLLEAFDWDVVSVRAEDLTSDYSDTWIDRQAIDDTIFNKIFPLIKPNHELQHSQLVEEAQNNFFLISNKNHVFGRECKNAKEYSSAYILEKIPSKIIAQSS